MNKTFIKEIDMEFSKDQKPKVQINLSIINNLLQPIGFVLLNLKSINNGKIQKYKNVEIRRFNSHRLTKYGF